jgi:Animal haem peroxidase
MIRKEKRKAMTDLSRRRFLKKVGFGTAAGWAAGALRIPFVRSAQPPDVSRPDSFGRMFRLPPFAPPTDAVREALSELGKAGGIMDAHDDLAAGPTALIGDPQLNLVNRNSTSHTAGVTFFGQFLDHDVTFDSSSRLGFPSQPIKSSNTRTPFLDLDSVYASGPNGTPELYDPADPIKLKFESGGLFEDLPRNPTTLAAFIGDPRNDENLMIAGLHAAFLLFHNRAVDYVRLQTLSISDDEAFAEARRLTAWHYQWMILHEFLPLIVGQPVVNEVLKNGRRFYNPLDDQEFIPVEWQIVYRFGHSMVRPSYRANMKGDGGEPFFGMIFDPKGQGSPDPIDLRGGARAPRRFIGWQTFFNFGGEFSGDARPNKLIDTKISTPLFNLPLGAIASGTPPVSLMQRNLLRHLTWGLPSGQAVAREMGVPQLGSADLSELQPIAMSFVSSTPLFYYILKEAEIMENGSRLGPVGGRIVAEIFIGLLQLDPQSYLSIQPNWLPTVPAQGGTGESFRMIDFLTFAGVDPTSRGQ